MKKLWATLACVVVLQGCVKDSTPPLISPSNPPSVNGQDKYEIRYEGPKGTKLTAIYVTITDGDPTARAEQLEITLPKTITFTAPQKTSVNASGAVFPPVKYSIRIFRNDKECGKPLIISTTIDLPNRDCAAELE